MDASGNIIIGGNTKDDEIIKSSPDHRPLLVYMNQGSIFKWAKTIESSRRAEIVKFNPLGTSAICVLNGGDSTKYHLYLFDVEWGEQLAGF